MHSLTSIIGKVTLSVTALGVLVVFAGAPGTQAQEFRERPVVRYDNFREREAIGRQGYFSPQASYWHHERREAFEHGWRDRYGCWHRY